MRSGQKGGWCHSSGWPTPPPGVVADDASDVQRSSQLTRHPAGCRCDEALAGQVSAARVWLVSCLGLGPSTGGRKTGAKKNKKTHTGATTKQKPYRQAICQPLFWVCGYVKLFVRKCYHPSTGNDCRGGWGGQMISFPAIIFFFNLPQK